MNEQTLNRQKLLRYLVLGAIFFLILGFLFNYSFLTISSNDSGKKTVYVKGLGDDYFMQFYMTEGSKTLLVKRGVYGVEVVADDKHSLYDKKLRLLSMNKLGIEVKSQKNSVYHGQSNLPCSRLDANSSFIFYSCNPSSLSLISSVTSAAPATAADTPDDAFSSSLKPVDGGFMKASAQSGELTIEELDMGGNSLAQIKLKGFEGSLSDNVFSAVSKSNVAVFDVKKQEIIKLKGAKDKKPVRISVLENRLNVSDLETQLIHSPDSTYLLSYSSDLYKHSPEDLEDEEAMDQRFLVYGSDNELIKEHTLPEDWFIRHISNSSDGRVLFFLSGNKNDHAYTFKGANKIEQIRLGVDIPQRTCWKDNNSFYFLANSSSSIYLHSLSESASYLVYGGLTEGSIISGLSCDKGTLTYTLDSDKDGEVGSFFHYRLGSNDHSGIRTESVLPIYFDLNKDIYKLAKGQAGVEIQILDDNGDGINASQEEVRAAATEKLRGKGVKVDQIKLIFGF